MSIVFWGVGKGKKRLHGYKWQPMSGKFKNAYSVQVLLFCACICWGIK